MNTKTVHLALYDTLADWEFGFATARINNPAFQKNPGSHVVRTVGATLDPITTMGGLRVLPDLVLADVDPADSAMLILPGADSWEGDANAGFARAARRWLEAGVPVAAICGGTVGLAAEGLLNDRPHAGNAVEELSGVEGYTGAAHFLADRAVRSGGLITAGAASALEFAREVLAELDLYDPAVLEAWYGLFHTADPVWFGKLMAAAS
ncbi:DJ-1/PfpI family protein [Actinosynnema sp. NPDC047251]|uniref:Putative intracellular protease, PfpI family n=1 Tax=Saccharothrix espanaensis (strain ATCC 51144 / DSM 44229 / JCM 9112 / NBRC 15066 / NRRL 15764) TaxID=1179773 RepID=K0JSE8_SACES|nr:DJ-1/PfpI family protein [Saccharothrix espanaensis]CCH28796.1 putative intracellular protease, PfpI family [Saccharothrix espanaensis DSM 44229]